MYDVCIADDETLIQKSISARLQASGTPTRVLGCADNAESAIILYWSSKPDIFFVDINMPGMDGLNLVRRIREEDPACATKFIIITGYDDFGHLREAIQSGVMDYLKKPISTEEFNQVLSAAAKLIQQERKRHSQAEDGSSYYDEYIAGSPRVLSAGSLLAAYAPSQDILNEPKQAGETIPARIGFSGEGEIIALNFHNVRNIRLYYRPGTLVSRHTLLTSLNPLILRSGMSFVYAYPRGERLEDLVERMEQSLNSRFLRPGLIECSRKNTPLLADMGMLNYALEHPISAGASRKKPGLPLWNTWKNSVWKKRRNTLPRRKLP
jgi:DNA-binding NarL/FixJ family response regulator